ncbi:MAG TPA: iron ABC transporter permease [Frankiaceae bacterium]|nr:iron ABC transporter permease [Frankiaceae bacterium]
MLPIVYLLVRAAGGGLDVVRRTLLRDRTAELVGRSLLLAVTVTAAATVLGVGLAWLTVRCDVPGRRAWQVVCALPLAIPTYVAGFAYVSRYPGLAGFRGAWLVLTLYSYPYVYLPVSAALASLDPAQGEAARSLGATPGRVFFGVTLRQLRPAIATGGLLVALYALSDFGAVSLMRYTAFTRAIYLSYQGGFDRTPAAIYGCVLVAITVVLVVAEGRARGRARYYAAGRGSVRRAPLQRLRGPARLAAFAALSGMALLTLGVPAVTLARWLAAGTSSAVVSDTVRAAASSLGASALGAVVTALAALPIGLLAARYAGSRAARFAEGASYAGHALPGIVIALSLVFFATRYAGALYQRLPTLVFAYVVLFLPLAVAAIYGSAVNASPRLEEVALSLGTTPFGALTRVTAPLVAPGVGAGAALVFLTCMKELPATLLLRPTGFDTLATRVWSETSSGAYAAAAPAAALLIAVAAVPTWLLTRRTGLAP